MFTAIITRWSACSLATRWALLAVLATALNAWAGALLAAIAVWQDHRDALFQRHLALWWSLPVAMALITLAYGQALPPDDLMRHLSAWRLGFDYRAQYPWSDIPEANLWLGFDYALGQLQQWGADPAVLLKWLPGAGALLSAGVLYLALRRSLPARHLNPELLLLVGALGLLLTTPRMLLGRPEAFLAVLGGAAWICRTPRQAAAWLMGYALLIPGYWLGWVYAPFALLLPISGRIQRVLVVLALAVVHLTFWQLYTGDYLGLLLWLRATMMMPALENAPLMQGLAGWTGWLFLLLLSGAVALRLPHSRAGRWRKLAHVMPAVAILLWFTLPNQVRYQAAMAFATLPWILRTLGVAAIASRRRGKPWRVAPILVLAALGVAGLQQVGKREPPPAFKLSATARVYSEQPYATVFYGEPGIAVEPSFALGATRPEWRDLIQNGTLNCLKLQRGRFTHLVEQSLSSPPPCATLAGLQGPWRLWTIHQEHN